MRFLALLQKRKGMRGRQASRFSNQECVHLLKNSTLPPREMSVKNSWEIATLRLHDWAPHRSDPRLDGHSL